MLHVLKILLALTPLAFQLTIPRRLYVQPAHYEISTVVLTCQMEHGKEVCHDSEPLDDALKDECLTALQVGAERTFWGNSDHRVELRLLRRANGATQVWLTGRRLIAPQGEITFVGYGITPTAAVALAFIERHLYCNQHVFAPACM